MTKRGDDAGFTLMEAIVSLAIFAMAIVAVQRGFATGSRAIREAELESRAVALAQTLLASAGNEIQLQDGGGNEGRSHALSWRTAVASYRTPDGNPDDPQRLRLFWVEANVQWRTSALAPLHSVTLKTLKSAEIPRR